MDTKARQQNKIKELKLERITQFNKRLRQDLATERVSASTRCIESINYMNDHKDYLVKEIWGDLPPGKGYAYDANEKHTRQSDPTCCCIT